LSLRQLDLWMRHLLVGNPTEEMGDDVQAGTPLVIGMSDKPGRPGGIRGLEHFVPRPRVVVPAAVGFEVHRRKLPDLSPVFDARLETPRLFLGAYLQPVFQEEDSGIDHLLLDGRSGLQEPARLLFGTETHDALDAGAIVPAAIEDHDFAGRGEVRKIAL